MNIDKHKDLMTKYGIKGIPTLYYLDPEGSRVELMTSRTPDALRAQIEGVLEKHRRAPKWEEREPRELKPQEMDDCWAAMAGKDVAAAYEAMWTLGAARAKAVEYVRGRLLPSGVSERAKSLIEALDTDEVEAREAAAKELKAMGAAAEAALREALVEAKGERRSQIEAILAVLDSAETVRRRRAVVLLERLDARAMLEELAKRGIAEAKAALERLRKK